MVSIAEGPVLSIRGLSKTFGEARVLEDVHLDVFAGKVHALLGQNGSGKSTIIKILSGFHSPDPGEAHIELRGREVPLPLPNDSVREGMAFVHQDLGLVGTASILDSIRVRRYKTGLGWRISKKRESALTRQALERFGLNLEPSWLIDDLADVDQANVAIVRALDQLVGAERGILVLDEPTAYLSREVIHRLFEVIKRAARDGFAVIIVTHRLEEAFAIADHVTVIRDGRVVTDGPIDSYSAPKLVEHIVGSLVGDPYPTGGEPSTDIVMSAQGLTTGILDKNSFSLRRGEILGLTGLRGMGWEEVPYAVFGATPATGTLTVRGSPTELSRMNPRRALALGLSLIPGNRLRDGGVAEASVTENLTLPTLKKYWMGGRLRLRGERRRVAELTTIFDLKPPNPSASMGTFSGGNQQKVILAKWLETKPSVLLIHEPVQGVDIGARQQIFRLIREAVEGGASVLVSSGEYDDLAGICDRVLIYRHGQIVNELTKGALSEQRIAQECLR